MSETLLWEVKDGVGRITFNRPETLNAWSPQLARELAMILTEEAADPEVRMVMITGAGRMFSSGADLKDLSSMGSDGFPDVRTPMLEAYNPAIAAIRRLDKPVLAVVNGPVLGIAFAVLLASDLVIMAESAYCQVVFVNIGLMPDGGASWMLPAVVGKARAFEMAMLGEKISAAQALEWGIVNRVVPDDRLAAEADALAERLAGGPTRAYAAMKQAFNASVYAGLEEQLALEADLQQGLVRTTDFFQGVFGFLQKIKPTFTGS